MFPSAKHIPPPTIKVFRGNTVTLTFSDLKLNGEDKPTVLSGESILFIVKSPMGTTVLSKTLVGSDETETPIRFELTPSDTVDLFAPFKYNYSIDLYTNNGETFFTLQKGNFVLMKSIGTIYDINENTEEGD